MKNLVYFTIFLLAFACVPPKKYNDLLNKEKQCSEQLEKYKANALNYESEALNLKSKVQLLTNEVEQLKKDTTQLGEQYRLLNAKYKHIVHVNNDLENQYGSLQLNRAKETATLSASLEAKQIELQQKENRLRALEKELNEKESLLVEREKRVNELERIIREQEEATRLLKEKVAQALIGFKDKGLKVEERDGKIYVSLEAKLLFKSGSTIVEPEGIEALSDLAKVLENEKDLEIIVEGHTDTDPLRSNVHPKNNWELSVLRATSVIDIMLKDSNIDPKQLIAAGRSEYLPVDASDKSKNRRIEIIISPNLDELFELIQK